MLELKDLILSEVYVGEFLNNNKPTHLTFHTLNDNMVTPFINLISNEFRSNGCLGHPRFKALRLATFKEKAWLNECIKQNKFVPLDQIKIDNYYEIY